MKGWTAHEGLSAIEIAVVCVITAVLASIAIPNFITIREDTREIACLNSMRKIHEAAATNTLVSGNGTDFTQLFEAGEMPICPSGGAYTYNNDGSAGTFRDHSIRCNVHTDLPAQGY